MKSITFTCTMSVEESKKLVHQKELMLRVCIWLLLVIGVGIFFLLFPKEGTHDILHLSLFLYILVMFLLALLVVWYQLRKVPFKYALILTKEFGWDETTSQFIYKDSDRTLRFKSTDIKKWYSLEEDGYDESEEINLAGTTDIIHLKTGEKIVLESMWNESVHKFLKSNRIALDLPEPKRRKWY